MNHSQPAVSPDVVDGIDMSMEQKHTLRLQILESNYGRDDGWYVEEEGERVAVLSEPEYHDMFWECYRIEVLTDNPVIRQAALTSLSFWQDRSLVFRSRRFGLVAEYAVAGHMPMPGRIIMRGLYLPVRIEPAPRVPWWRKLFPRKMPHARKQSLE
jgi:hypothetical protein